MVRTSFLLGLMAGTIGIAAAAESSCAIVANRLQVAGNSMAVVDTKPRLSWAVGYASPSAASQPKGQSQSSYKIQVWSAKGSSTAPDLWDSGIVQSSETIRIPYGGKPLQSAMEVNWRVQIVDHAGQQCGWSTPAVFETALYDQSDWSGDWLSRDPVIPDLGRNECTFYELKQAPKFRTTFSISSSPSSPSSSAATVAAPTIVRARAYIAGLGYYKLFINGVRVGESELDPGFTNVSMQVLYAVYNVEPHLNLRSGLGNSSSSGSSSGGSSGANGAHTIGVEVGNGWWNPLPLRFWGHDNVRTALTTGEPMFRLELRIELSDGTTKVINSNPSDWSVGGTPTLFNNIYLGEKYDARLETDAWHNADFDTSRDPVAIGGGAGAGSGATVGWTTPLVVKSPGPMVAQSAPPIKRVQELTVTRMPPAPAPPPPPPPPAPNPTCGAKCMCGMASEPAVGKPLNPAPSFTLQCSPGETITSIDFASFGRPTGSCGAFKVDPTCDASDSMAAIKKLCEGKSSCTVEAEYDHFGANPCPGKRKSIYVQASGCTPAKPAPPAPPAPPPTPLLIYDAGKNHAGQCEYTLEGPAGAVVSMRYGELLHADGTLNPMTSVAGQIKGANPNAACQPTIAYQADEVTLAGGETTWSPSWSWHGFRFIEVTVPAATTVKNVKCWSMRSSMNVVANFSSSNPQLQQLRTLNRNTYDSNMMSIQSDCPHRERFGYGGDPLGCGEAGLSIYDFSSFYRKRVGDFVDSQRPEGEFTETAPFVSIADAPLKPGTQGGPIGWETYPVVAQLWLYKYYGDVDIMAESFNATYAYIKILDAANHTVPHLDENGLGDWMAVEGTSTTFTGQGFVHMGYSAFANITAILGMHDLSAEYSAKADAVAAAINAKYLNVTNGAYAVGTSSKHGASQCGQGMGLFMQITPEEVRSKALQVMVDNAEAATMMRASGDGPDPGGPGPHMTAGLFGIKWFLMALADGDQNDLAYDVLTTQSYPGYGYMMNNKYANASTLWESWFFSDNTFSHNHPMFASSEVWLMQSVAGIQPHPEARGMDRVLIRPRPPTKLESASGAFDTPRGTIKTAWGKTPSFYLNVTIPPNVVADVYVPKHGGAVRGGSGGVGGHDDAAAFVLLDHGAVMMENDGGKMKKKDTSALHGAVLVQVGSGHYSFSFGV